MLYSQNQSILHSQDSWELQIEKRKRRKPVTEDEKWKQNKEENNSDSESLQCHHNHTLHQPPHTPTVAEETHTWRLGHSHFHFASLPRPPRMRTLPWLSQSHHRTVTGAGIEWWNNWDGVRKKEKCKPASMKHCSADTKWEKERKMKRTKQWRFIFSQTHKLNTDSWVYVNSPDPGMLTHDTSSYKCMSIQFRRFLNKRLWLWTIATFQPLKSRLSRTMLRVEKHPYFLHFWVQLPIKVLISENSL